MFALDDPQFVLAARHIGILVNDILSYIALAHDGDLTMLTSSAQNIYQDLCRIIYCTTQYLLVQHEAHQQVIHCSRSHLFNTVSFSFRAPLDPSGILIMRTISMVQSHFDVGLSYALLGYLWSRYCTLHLQLSI
jgi:hypothetical protein